MPAVKPYLQKMATRGRPRKPKPQPRDFLTREERIDLDALEATIKADAKNLAALREERRRILQMAAARMRRSGA